MPRIHRSILLALLILVGGLAAPALHTSAATPAPAKMASMPGVQVITYYAGPVEHPVKVPPPDAFLQRAQGVGAQTATITVNYNGTWDANAQNAFQYAVDIWKTLITSPVAITVDAYWEDLTAIYGPGVLGAAGATSAWRDFPGALVPGTWYPAALANKLAGSDISSGTEIEASFNSTFSNPGWHFGTDGQPGAEIDFVSVVLHELGHGLGFAGSMWKGGPYCSTSSACWGRGSGYPFIYDRFAIDGSGQYLISSFANNSPELAAQLTSGSIYFNGTNAVKANGNANVKLYAPGAWSQGSSYAHLDNVFDGTPNALMTFSIANGESIHNPGSVTLCMFKDMGWTVTVSGASAASTSAMSAPGFAAFSPDNVTVMVTSTVYLPLVMNSYSTAPC